MEESRRNAPFNRTAFLQGGSTALIVSWTLATLLSGCRFGNYTSSTTNPDTISGFYDTHAETLKFCAATPLEQCASASVNQVPTLISAEMTSPVALIVQDLASGAAAFTSYAGGNTSLSVDVNPDKTLTLSGHYAPQTLFRDAGCTSMQSLDEEGSIQSGPANAVPNSTHSTLGRIQVLIRVTTTLQDQTLGSCATTRQAMSSCYQNVTQCGGASPDENQTLQSQVQALFGPYISAGVMTASGIANVTSLAYEIQYQ